MNFNSENDCTIFKTCLLMLNFTYRTDEFQTRWSAVKREIKSTGTYELTHEELEYGVQLCWRNEPRCSARIQWKNLVSLRINHSVIIFNLRYI